MFRSSARPFVCLWFAVADGVTGYPKGSLICYRELYGGSENVGLRLSAEQVADRLHQCEAGDEVRPTYSVADPSIFAHDGGPSIGERFADRRLFFSPADNKRIGILGHLAGWDMLRARLVGEDDRPLIYFFNTCLNCIRTIPMMQHDELRPEDMDSSGDDHCADATRYACMSRPWVAAPPVPPVEGVTLEKLFALRESELRKW
jgi:hypothetical protein